MVTHIYQPQDHPLTWAIYLSPAYLYETTEQSVLTLLNHNITRSTHRLSVGIDEHRLI